MQNNHRRLAVLLCAGAAIALIAQAADLVKPNIRLGLWETRITGKASGPPPIPEEVLARLPPERRAQFMAAAAGAAGRAVAMRQCVTADKLAQGLAISSRARADCQRKVLSSSTSEMSVHEDCSDPSGGKESVDVHFSWASDHVAGTVHAVIQRGPQSMTTDRTIEGHWVGADCGGVKDVEIVK